MRVRRFLFKAVLIILGIGIFAEKPISVIAFLLLGLWHATISYAVFTRNNKLLEVIAPETKIISPTRAKVLLLALTTFFFICAIIESLSLL